MVVSVLPTQLIWNRSAKWKPFQEWSFLRHEMHTYICKGSWQHWNGSHTIILRSKTSDLVHFWVKWLSDVKISNWSSFHPMYYRHLLAFPVIIMLQPSWRNIFGLLPSNRCLCNFTCYLSLNRLMIRYSEKYFAPDIRLKWFNSMKRDPASLKTNTMVLSIHYHLHCKSSIN